LDKKLVFIASGGRTGTQFLGELLATVIDDAWSEHEADMFAGFSRKSLQRIQHFGLWHMVFGRALGQTGLRAAGTRYLTGKRSLAESVQELRDQRQKYHTNIDQSLIIESYWRWWMFAGQIGQIWSGAKTVGIVRDPRSWINSWLSRDSSHAGDPWAYRFPPGPITPRTMDDETWALRWQELSPVGRLAWEWQEIYSRIEKGCAEDPNARLFRFEDLFSGEDSAMQSLIEFVCDHGDVQFHSRSLDGFRDSRRNTSGAMVDDWLKWTPEEQELVEELCGPLMRKFGYEPMSRPVAEHAA